MANLVPRVLRLLGQRFGRQERLWGNGIISVFLIGYSGNNEIVEAEVGSMLTLPSIMSRTEWPKGRVFSIDSQEQWDNCFPKILGLQRELVGKKLSHQCSLLA